ncbi:MAG: trehalose-phosphatase [Halarsenatibacteraceae bacterium]
MNNQVKYLSPDSPKNWPEKLKREEFQLFLDYDGTLAPFKSDPDQAYPIKGINQLINKYLEKNILVIIVTGRNSLDIRDKFIKPKIPVIGLHGREYLSAEENKPLGIGPRIKSLPDKLLKYINKLVDQNPVKLEDKDNSWAIHLKNNDNLQEYLHTKLNKILQELNYQENWEVISGRKVLEVRYKGWNKADAVNKYRINEKLTIYIGDDRTDEDVFKNLSEPGLSIYVQNEDKNLNTKADYYLKNPSDVIKFLKNLLILRIKLIK